MKICIVKPDYGIRGGFEIVIDKIEAELSKRGYDITQHKVNMATTIEQGRAALNIDSSTYEQNFEFFNMIISIIKFNSLDLSEYDAVISTIPPSYAVKHKNLISIFYHHHRKSYDMLPLTIEQEKNENLKIVREKSAEVIRKIEKPIFERDIVFLPGSKNIANRLEKFNSIKIKDEDIFYAGVDDMYFNYNGKVTYNTPICVGRHEFPKRVELFIAAVSKIQAEATLVGVGGYTEKYKKFSSILEVNPSKINDINSTDLWKNFNDVLVRLDDGSTKASKRITFKGEASQKALFEEYKQALCVVCPAYDEDYGLTPIEAMCLKKPVIVCKDGGGLVESVIDGVTGFVVEPDIEKIAEKIKFFIDNPDKAREMGEAGYQLSRKYDWKNAIDLLENKLKEIGE